MMSGKSSAAFASSPADDRRPKASSCAPVLWGGAEGRARRFSGFCSTIRAVARVFRDRRQIDGVVRRFLRRIWRLSGLGYGRLLSHWKSPCFLALTRLTADGSASNRLDDPRERLAILEESLGLRGRSFSIRWHWDPM